MHKLKHEQYMSDAFKVLQLFLFTLTIAYIAILTIIQNLYS